MTLKWGPDIPEEEFQAIFIKWVQAREKQKERGRLGRALHNPKLGWAAREEYDKFGTVEEAIKYIKIVDELRATEGGRQKLRLATGVEYPEEFGEGGGI